MKHTSSPDETLHARLLDQLPHLVCTFHPETCVLTYVNAMYCKAFKLPAEALLGRSFLELIPESDRDAVRERVNTLSARTPHQTYEHRVVVGDEIRWQRWVDQCIFDAQGRIVAVDSYGEDITERKTLELGLADSQRKLELSLQAGAVGLWSWIDNAIDWDEQVLRIHEVDAPPSSPEGFLALIHPEDRPRMAERIQSAMETGVYDETRVRILTRDGRTKWILCRADVRYDESGRFHGLYGATIDVTHIQTTEKRLQDAKRQLQRSQKLEAIGTLAGGVAHDFNNILGMIRLSTDLALSDLDEGTSPRTHLEDLQETAQRGKQLVEQILTFSRVSALSFSALDLVAVVRHALELLRATLPTPIDIRFDAPPTLPPVRADEGQIHQLIVNLCTNASHAMQRGGQLRVSLSRSSTHDTPHALLTVEDEGTGISPELLDKVFDPFFTTKDVQGGTGLGLSVVHGIVQEHGGEIEIDSELGRGTRVRIALPFASERHTSNPALSAINVPRRKHILVAEDEPLLGQQYQTLMERIGYQVTLAADGRRALEIFQASPERFDLLFTDHAMPHMTGVQLTEAVLALRPDLPVVLCTGYNHQIQDKISRLRIREVLSKPTSLRTIRDALERFLGPPTPQGKPSETREKSS